jgi:hypothetical protein
MEISSIQRLKSVFAGFGVEDILIKVLAQHQDNEKNQIVIAGRSPQLISLLPGNKRFGIESKSKKKSHSNYGASKIEVDLDFYWFDSGGIPQRAPGAKVIDYFQYPEIRLSGFMRSCSIAPDSLRRDRQQKYGRRALALGISGNKIYATVVTEAGGTLINGIAKLPGWGNGTLFKILSSGHSASNLLDETKLLNELRTLSGNLWSGRRLASLGSAPISYNATNGGGYTLEALLHVPSNAISGPDKYGFELKSVSGSPMSLMTTEPDYGYRHDYGVKAFLNKYGWKSTKTSGKTVFYGKHDTLKINSKSKLKLVLENWDSLSNMPNGAGDPNLLLLDKKDAIAAAWSFSHLSKSWSNKHGGAMFVQTKCVTSSGVRSYLFGPIVWSGIGTDPIMLLQQISLGNLYIDPGDSMYGNSSPHPRTQWRVAIGRGSKGDWSRTLTPFYNSLSKHSL